jgi:MFS family permease
MNTAKPNTLTLLLLTAFASVAAVLYTPALPAITHFFAITTGQAQTTLSSFLLAYAIAPIFYGPLAQRYGRKPTLFLGIIIGLIGMGVCIASYCTGDFSLLIIGRFIEGFGTGAGLVIALTMVQDTYTGPQARKVMSLATLSFAFLPGLAIYIAGLLLKHFSWVSNFYFMMAYTFFILACALMLPETRPVGKIEPLRLRKIAQDYLQMLSDKILIRYTVMWSLTTAFMYLFAAYTPFIVINHLGYSPETYGAINALAYLSLLVGNLISVKTSSTLTGLHSILLGIIITSIGSVSFALSYAFNILDIYSLYGSVMVAFIGMPIILSNASALAGAHIAPEHKAVASATTSMINMGLAVAIMLALGCWHANPGLVLSVSFVGLMVLEIIIYNLTKAKPHA